MPTERQIEQAELDANAAAAAMTLLLLTQPDRVEYRSDVGRFYVDGKSVSITTIRTYIARIETRQGARLTKLVDDLEAKRITLAGWQRETERVIVTSHVLMAALALGSITAAISNPDLWARIEAEIAYLDGFRADIANGKVSPKAQASRAKSYLLAAFVTYGIFEREIRQLLGQYTECRRVRRASESCSGCIQYAYRWMPIQDMPPLGSLDCGSRCRCYLEYR